MRIAPSARIDGGVRIEVDRGARLTIGERCHLGPHVRIFARAGSVELQEGAALEERSTLVALERIAVGADARIGPRAAVTDFELDSNSGEPAVRRHPLLSQPVEIGAGAIVGAGAVVEAGAQVPAGITVPPGTVLTVKSAGRPAESRR